MLALGQILADHDQRIGLGHAVIPGPPALATQIDLAKPPGAGLKRQRDTVLLVDALAAIAAPDGQRQMGQLRTPLAGCMAHQAAHAGVLRRVRPVVITIGNRLRNGRRCNGR